MSASWLKTVIALVAIPLVIPSRLRLKQCLSEYIPKISSFGLEQEYINGLHDIINARDKQVETPNVNVILDVGLGSMWQSDVFRHIVQLNITGYDPFLRSSYNCQFESIPREKISKFREYVVMHNKVSHVYSLGSMAFRPFGESWYQVLADHPNVFVLMNDVTDSEYFENQYSASCELQWQRRIQEHCFVPLLHLPHRHHVNVTSHRHMLNKFTYDQVKVMLAAYRSLITCIVPAERLFQFNLNQMPALEYWSKLTTFLNISLPSASSLKYLSEGGSVCDSVSHHSDSRHAKRVQCADEYGSKIASIFGEKYRKFVRDSLLKDIYAPRRAPEDTDRLVLGIGPGTSGTRSIHFAAAQLIVTSLHFVFLETPPQFRNNITKFDFEYDMRVLEKETTEGRIFWSDTPVPNRWWYVYKMYPNSNFMITDLGNDTLYYEKRYREHCNFSMVINQPDCIAPLPIRFDKSIHSLEFFRMTQIKLMTPEINSRVYDAYRALAKCVIPPERLWWLFMNDLKDSKDFWTRLIALLRPKISPTETQQFIDRGIPRCGSKGCFWGGAKYNTTYR